MTKKDNLYPVYEWVSERAKILKKQRESTNYQMKDEKIKKALKRS